MSHFLVMVSMWIPLIILLTLWAFMQWFGKLPPVERIAAFMDSLNTRGGAGLVLLLLTIFFFRYAINIRISNSQDAELWGFLSATCFGAAFGALLTMLTGENKNKQG